MHNIVRQTYILKKNVEISTLSKGITHGRGFESGKRTDLIDLENGITHGRGFESKPEIVFVHFRHSITHGRGFELVRWSGTSRLLEDEEWALS